jgi:hypothetical protein
MHWVALRILTGDRGKCLALLFGVTFAALLMSQQVSIFWGVMRKTTSQIRDVKEADVWVMDPRTRYLDEAPALASGYLARVRGVPGVEWAVPFYKGTVQARLRGGASRLMILLGVDDTTLVGAPREMVLGSVDDLRRPDGIVLGEAGYHLLWPGEPLRLGRTLEINDRRAASTRARPSSMVMSPGTAVTATPVSRRISAAVASSTSGRRAFSTRSTPSRARASAQARPSPSEAAQTMALRPRIPRSMIIPLADRPQAEAAAR